MYTQTSTTSFDFNAVLYDATGNLVQGATYAWDFGDGNTSTDAAPSHTYATEGIYTVLMHATTEDGCEVHTCDVVFAMDCQIDTFWYGCQAMYSASIGGFDAVGNPIDPLEVAFYDLSLGGVVSWAWNFGDGTTSNEQNPVHTYAQEGVYVVSLSITTLDGCESTAIYEICIGENCWLPELDCQALFLPIPDSLGGNGIQFLDFSISSNPVTTWSWDFGDGTTSNEQNPYHVFAQPGVYAVSLSIEGDSCSSVITFELDTENPWNFNNNSGDPAKLGQSTNAVATREATAAFESVKLFPNPAHNDLSVAFSSKQAGDYTLRISDLTGKTLQTSAQTAVIGVNAARLNIGNLVPGLYMAEIRSGESVQTIKFVKE
jgi:PKD repeat protein